MTQNWGWAKTLGAFVIFLFVAGVLFETAGATGSLVAGFTAGAIAAVVGSLVYNWIAHRMKWDTFTWADIAINILDSTLGW